MFYRCHYNKEVYLNNDNQEWSSILAYWYTHLQQKSMYGLEWVRMLLHLWGDGRHWSAAWTEGSRFLAGVTDNCYLISQLLHIIFCSCIFSSKTPFSFCIFWWKNSKGHISINNNFKGTVLISGNPERLASISLQRLVNTTLKGTGHEQGISQAN